MVAEISLIFDFSRWRPSAILDLSNGYLTHPVKILGGLYSCAKFGWNRAGSFQDGGHLPSWICGLHIWTTHEEYLMVFIVVQIWVEINQVVWIIRVFLFCHCGLKMPINAPKMGFVREILPPKWVMVRTGCTKGTSLHRNTSYDAQIVEIGQMVVEISQFFDFFKMAAVRHPRREVGGLYSCTKFRSNRYSSFWYYEMFTILRVWIENAYSRPKNWCFGSFLP